MCNGRYRRYALEIENKAFKRAVSTFINLLLYPCAYIKGYRAVQTHHTSFYSKILGDRKCLYDTRKVCIKFL